MTSPLPIKINNLSELEAVMLMDFFNTACVESEQNEDVIKICNAIEEYELNGDLNITIYEDNRVFIYGGWMQEPKVYIEISQVDYEDNSSIEFGYWTPREGFYNPCEPHPVYTQYFDGLIVEANE